MRTTVLLVGVATALLVADRSEAKFTCQQRGTAPNGIELRGLPIRPVVGRTYRLTVALPGRGPNPTPFLGALYCGEHRGRGVAGADGWFREAASEPGMFFADLRFSRTGRWALSFMDLEGVFHDFGIRRVVASPARVMSAREQGTEPLAAVSSGGISTWIWFAVGGTWLALGAALFLANRRKPR